MNELDRVLRMPIQREILARPFERSCGRIDGDDLLRTAGERRQCESALVAERVEHAGSKRHRARECTIVALI